MISLSTLFFDEVVSLRSTTRDPPTRGGSRWRSEALASRSHLADAIGPVGPKDQHPIYSF